MHGKIPKIHKREIGRVQPFGRLEKPGLRVPVEFSVLIKGEMAVQWVLDGGYAGPS